MYESEIGDISVKLLQALTNGACSRRAELPRRLLTMSTAVAPAVMQLVNHFTEQGFRLPTLKGISIVDPAVLYYPGDAAAAAECTSTLTCGRAGYFTVSTNFTYTPKL